MLLTYFLNDFEIVPVAPIITGITFVFTFHMRCISNVRSLYFIIFSASFLITFLYPEIATSVNIHVPFSLLRIIMSGLLLGIVLSVCLLLLLLLLLLYTHHHHQYTVRRKQNPNFVSHAMWEDILTEDFNTVPFSLHNQGKDLSFEFPTAVTLKLLFSGKWCVLR